MDIIPLESNVEEATEILELQKQAYQIEAQIYNDYTIQPLRQTLEELKEEYKGQKVLKVQIENKIVGSVRAYQKGDTCFLGKLIVHPSFQNKGIGTVLLLTVESLFPDAKRFELFTGSRSEKNLYLYSKNGYIVFKKESLTHNITLNYLEKQRVSS